MNDENSLNLLDEKQLDTMTIEFQGSDELLAQGIVPFPIKKVDIRSRDAEQLNMILSFYENLIREFWCKGKLKA